MKIFIGDVDEYYCDAVDGEYRRWAVWSSEVKEGRSVEKLLGRFDTEKQATKFAEEIKKPEDVIY